MSAKQSSWHSHTITSTIAVTTKFNYYHSIFIIIMISSSTYHDVRSELLIRLMISGASAKRSPWHFWKYQSRLTGVPEKSLCQKHENRSNPISADPMRPFLSIMISGASAKRSSWNSYTITSTSTVTAKFNYYCTITTSITSISMTII